MEDGAVGRAGGGGPVRCGGVEGEVEEGGEARGQVRLVGEGVGALGWGEGVWDVEVAREVLGDAAVAARPGAVVEERGELS